jgi:predicted nucleic acid-binding protein
MTPVFIDTSALVALTDSKDRNHSTAKRFFRSIGRSKRPLVTSTDIVDEAITLIRMRIGYEVAVKVGDALLHSRWCRLIEVGDEIRGSAWNIFVRYSDQTFSFTDCTSFALMQRMGVNEAFTYDRKDFSAAGFIPLPTSGQAILSHSSSTFRRVSVSPKGINHP